MAYTSPIDSNQESIDPPEWINEVRPGDYIKTRTTDQMSWIRSPVFEESGSQTALFKKPGSLSAIGCWGVDLSNRDKNNVKPILLKSRIEEGDKFNLYDREEGEWREVQKTKDGIKELKSGEKSELKYDSLVQPLEKNLERERNPDSEEKSLFEKLEQGDIVEIHNPIEQGNGWVSGLVNTQFERFDDVQTFKNTILHIDGDYYKFSFNQFCNEDRIRIKRKHFNKDEFTEPYVNSPKTIGPKEDPYEELPGQIVEFEGDRYRVEHVSGMMAYLEKLHTGEKIAVGYTEFVETEQYQ